MSDGIHRELLQEISPETPLVIEYGNWGVVGVYEGPGWNPISPAIVELWQLNNCLAPAIEGSAVKWVLSDFGAECAKGRIEEKDLKLPVKAMRGSSLQESEASDTPVGELLFTPAGTCRLCSKKMDIFGQISHAKSHIGKGHPVVIEESQGKKLAKLTGEPIAVEQPTSEPMSKEPKSAAGYEEGDVFSAAEFCQICGAIEGLQPKRVSVFGWISHCKSAHEGAYHIVMRKGKKVPRIGAAK